MHSFELLESAEVIFPSGVFDNRGIIVLLGYLEEQPEVTWAADDKALYTLLFVSSEAPHFISQDDYRKRPLMGHWLVANIPGNRVAEGQTIVEYRKPSKRIGLSRHLFLVFKQTIEYVNRGFYIWDSTDKRVHIVCSISSLMEGRFEVKSHHDSINFNLGYPTAGNNFQVREDFDDSDDYDHDRGYDHYHDHDFGINNSYDNVVYMKRLGTSMFLHYGSHDTEPVSCIDVVPSAEAEVIYPSGVSANLGNELTLTQVKDEPKVTWPTDDNALYTLLFVDPEATHARSYHDYQASPLMARWLVLNISGNWIKYGQTFVKYRGPQRIRGLHRYVFLVFKQTNRLDGSGLLGRSLSEARIVCSIASLIEGKFEIEISKDHATFNLGYPIAGNYFHVQYDKNDKILMEPDRLQDLLDLLPGAEAEVIYPSGVSAHYGNELTPTQVKEQPKVTWTADDSALYTLLFVDPEATHILSYLDYRKYPEMGQWLVVNIPGNRIAEGQTIVEYRGSSRIRGLHCYVFLVFKQTFRLLPRSLGQARITCSIDSLIKGKFKIESYGRPEIFELGYPIAGNYYHAQYDENDKILMEPDRLQDLLDLLPRPEAEVIYPSGVSARFGNELRPTQVKDQPKVTWTADDNVLYTLLFVDPEATHIMSYWDFEKYPLRAQWLVVNIPGNRISDGEIIAKYRGPPIIRGLHRYVFLVFKQTYELPGQSCSQARIMYSIATLIKGKFEIESECCVETFNLGYPIAGNYYHVQYDGNDDDRLQDLLDLLPGAEAEVIYPSGVSAHYGNELTPTQVKEQPKVTWTADDSALYTLLFVDPKATYTISYQDYRKYPEMGQWLVVNIPGNRIAEGQTIVEYRGSSRIRGLHCYVFLVFKQTSRLLRRSLGQARITCSIDSLIKGKFKIESYYRPESFELGYPIAGNYYHAQYDENDKILMEPDRLQDLLDLLPRPEAEVIYPSGVSARFGNELRPTQVKDQPKVTWTADDNALYTLLFVDPEATHIIGYWDLKKYPLRAQWLVVNIPGNRISDGEIIAKYRGPPIIRGLHRYVFLVFKQTDEHPGQSCSQARITCSFASLIEWNCEIKSYGRNKTFNFGYPIAGNYYYAQYDGNDDDRLQDLLDLLPGAVAEVLYPSGVSAHYGNELTPTQVKEQPEITWAADDNALYTLLFVDPEATHMMTYWDYRKYSKMGQWLVVNIPGNRVREGQTIIRYIGPGPRRFSGLRSYIFLVFKQYHKKEFYGRKRKNLKDAHIVCSMASLKWGTFEVKKLRGSMEFNLGLPIAGNYFQAQYDEYVDLLTKQLGYTSFSNYYDGYKKIETKL